VRSVEKAQWQPQYNHVSFDHAATELRDHSDVCGRGRSKQSRPGEQQDDPRAKVRPLKFKTVHFTLGQGREPPNPDKPKQTTAEKGPLCPRIGATPDFGQ